MKNQRKMFGGLFIIGFVWGLGSIVLADYFSSWGHEGYENTFYALFWVFVGMMASSLIMLAASAKSPKKAVKVTILSKFGLEELKLLARSGYGMEYHELDAKILTAILKTVAATGIPMTIYVEASRELDEEIKRYKELLGLMDKKHRETEIAEGDVVVLNKEIQAMRGFLGLFRALSVSNRMRFKQPI
jgi:hypothetical protein